MWQVCEGSHNRYAQTVFPTCEAAKCRVLKEDVMFTSGGGEKWGLGSTYFEVAVDSSHLTFDN